MTQVSFRDFFKSGNQKRDKFLSRLLGIFNEEIVSFWCRCPQAPYEDLGRPSVKTTDDKKAIVYDFTFQDRRTGAKYVVESKCMLEYRDYFFLTLSDSSQIAKVGGKGFKRFREIARRPNRYPIKVGGKIEGISGAILIWGRVTKEGVTSAKKEYGFHDVLSFDRILGKLLEWGSRGYSRFLQARAAFCAELFDFLRGRAS